MTRIFLPAIIALAVILFPSGARELGITDIPPIVIGIMIGCGITGLGMGLLWFVTSTGWGRQRRTIRPRDLPPATARQQARARRANRADLSRVDGWVPTSLHQFDTEDTR